MSISSKRVRAKKVVVQVKSQLTFDIKKDSSLPLGMTLRGFVIPNEVRDHR